MVSARRIVAERLRQGQLDELAALAEAEPGAVTTLVRGLYQPDAETRSRAADVLGRAAARMLPAQRARVERLLNRLVWALNDESGTTGWGVPQAIGEVVRNDVDLCRVHGPLLAAWLGEEDVEVGDRLMVQGVIHALGRAGERAPDAVAAAIPFLRQRLGDSDATTRGLAVRTLGQLRVRDAFANVEALRADASVAAVYGDGQLINCTVGALALESLAFLR